MERYDLTHYCVVDGCHRVRTGWAERSGSQGGGGGGGRDYVSQGVRAEVGHHMGSVNSPQGSCRRPCFTVLIMSGHQRARLQQGS